MLNQYSKMRSISAARDRKSTRLNSSHLVISYAVFCLKKKRRAARRPADETRHSARVCVGFTSVCACDPPMQHLQPRLSTTQAILCYIFLFFFFKERAAHENPPFFPQAPSPI